MEDLTCLLATVRTLKDKLRWFDYDFITVLSEPLHKYTLFSNVMPRHVFIYFNAM